VDHAEDGEHEEGGPEELGRQALQERRLVGHGMPPRHRMVFDIVERVA
jgi:hypothetical protein